MTKRKDHPLKIKARKVFRKAKYDGKIPPVSGFSCVDCGEPAEAYDHRDYSKPLDVEPVCTCCNVQRGSGKYSFVPEKTKEWHELSAIAGYRTGKLGHDKLLARALECYLDVYHPKWREQRVKRFLDTAEDLLITES